MPRPMPAVADMSITSRQFSRRLFSDPDFDIAPLFIECYVVVELFAIDHVRTILRASLSGSFTMRHSLSNTMVLFVSGSVGSQVKPGWLGFPVRAKLAHALAIFLASACASTVLPVPCAQRSVLSKQNASSAVCHAPASSSIGDCHVK